MIKVEKSKCIGCGLCVNMCPKTFQMNNQNKSELIADKDLTCAKQAAEACPVKAILIN